jgi:hypothetical protein
MAESAQKIEAAFDELYRRQQQTELEVKELQQQIKRLEESLLQRNPQPKEAA